MGGVVNCFLCDEVALRVVDGRGFCKEHSGAAFKMKELHVGVFAVSTQADVAKRLGVDHSTISHREKAKRGMCMWCGSRKKPSRSLCDECLKKSRVSSRARYVKRKTP
jgi:DNA-binding XRE family transcriptional regulator